MCKSKCKRGALAWPVYPDRADPQVADLYRLQLGKPLTRELAQGAIHYRVFERGLVAVNLDGVNAGDLSLQSPPIPTTYFHFPNIPGQPNITTTYFHDLSPLLPHQQNIKVFMPGGALPVPASSGRVYLLRSPTDYGLNRLT